MYNVTMSLSDGQDVSCQNCSCHRAARLSSIVQLEDTTIPFSLGPSEICARGDQKTVLSARMADHEITVRVTKALVSRQ